MVGKAKPGATALAYVAGRRAGPKPEENSQAQQEQALFVRHNYGFGRVLLRRPGQHLAVALRIGDVYHHRFWSQTIRWAASDKPLVAGNTFVRFGTPQAMLPRRRGGQADGTALRDDREAAGEAGSAGENHQQG